MRCHKLGRRSKRKQLGFTLVELILTMGIITNILATVMPDMNAMFLDAKLSKAEQELLTIKSAVGAYWKNNSFVYPSNIHSDLVNSTPQVLTHKLKDPWTTDMTDDTYGYLVGDDPEFGPYFAIYTWGPRYDSVPVWNSVSKKIEYSGAGKVVGNAPILRL
jgi:type II secretory pathway pseudopilin PulG